MDIFKNRGGISQEVARPAELPEQPAPSAGAAPPKMSEALEDSFVDKASTNSVIRMAPKSRAPIHLTDAVQRFINQSPVPIESVSFTSAGALQHVLQEGDILLNYNPESSVATHRFIRGGQSLAKLYTPTSTSQSDAFTHASLHTGDGRIVEAVGKGLSASELGSDYVLSPQATNAYLVLRPKDKAMAQEASRVALDLTKTGESFPYATSKALFSAVISSDFTDESLKRYLSGAALAHAGLAPNDVEGIRDFFCSHFVGWACQAGESKEVLQNANRELGEGQKIEFPNLTGLNGADRKAAVARWADETTKQHGELLKKNIRIKLDPQYTTPQRFYGFALEHPELFDHAMMIVPPPAETLAQTTERVQAEVKGLTKNLATLSQQPQTDDVKNQMMRLNELMAAKLDELNEVTQKKPVRAR